MTLIRSSLPRLLALAIAFALPCLAAATDASGFGAVVVPQPEKPAAADACVEPVEVMRREHMQFLDHQRDVTVIDGERGSKYSLVGCMNCHNPAGADGKAPRYEDTEHFCADCHRFASVRIDCFECHADRGLTEVTQGQLDAGVFAATRNLKAATFDLRRGTNRVD